MLGRGRRDEGLQMRGMGAGAYAQRHLRFHQTTAECSKAAKAKRRP